MKVSRGFKMKAFFIVFSALLVILCSLALFLQWGPPPSQPSEEVPVVVPQKFDRKKARAMIKTVHGKIIFKFYPKEAPHTVTRIIELINQGFYDGLTFHRVIPNFVVQGGDPLGTGTGGSGQKLKAEFNDIQHIKGTLAMARAEDVDSADSQFYIALTRLPHLDGKYTVFGQVTSGLEVLDKIRPYDKILSISFQEKGR